jgi:hypothetical protein
MKKKDIKERIRLNNETIELYEEILDLEQDDDCSILFPTLEFSIASYIEENNILTKKLAKKSKKL